MIARRFRTGPVTFPALRVPFPSSIHTGKNEGRCAVGTPLRRSRKELTCRQEP